MNGLGGGSFRLFRLAGINVCLHWSWLLVAYVQILNRVRPYSSPLWNVAEYVTLFGIVLLHELGHAFACRQVGGKADHIVLWPLGGLALVQAPARPGAWLWTSAAGPLVNVLLVPVTFILWWLVAGAGGPQRYPDVAHFLAAVAFINLGLLVFNLLPIYPLDGGQILHALLWLVLGRGRSLQAACVLGLAGGAGLVTLALAAGSVWLAVLAGFIALGSWGGLQQAHILLRLERDKQRRSAKPAHIRWQAETFAEAACVPAQSLEQPELESGLPEPGRQRLGVCEDAKA
jgi:Zn-dependent protease